MLVGMSEPASESSDRASATEGSREHVEEVTVKDNPQEQRYEAWLNGELAGFAQYKLRPGVVIVTHTEVPDQYAGHGIGTAIVRGTLDDLRARGLKVRPVCPFFKSWIERHPDYQDLVD
ncbi:hypothetical protein EV186_103378 [Labedaea rhizosphaerae]|uniref:Uncharacterized protein n=1 Tax=Labedaea rhizosphaerae TaxID=598644 RepID=A0A4R6SCM9_LABRH|nr:hypothetical protein EV186_103378 [Labedaea rhizosphaerae]